VIAAVSPPMSAVDVLVVGAGPAGATAARALALAGVRVSVIDRAAFPRNKPCGGGISMRAIPRFPYLERQLSRIATHTVSRLHLEGPDSRSTIIQSDRPAALMIRRVEFDALLLSLAREAGAEFISGVDVVQAREERDRVVLTSRDGRRFEAPILIAADGVHSTVGHRLGLNPGWPAHAVALDMMEETPRDLLRDVDPSTMWVAYGYSGTGVGADPGTDTRPRRAAEGYAYIFPKRDHVNIGIGYVLSYYRSAIADAPYDLQRGLIDRLRERGIVVGRSVRRNFTPFLIPVGGPLRPPGRGRVLLAGDAGGFVNGFTAEGIYYAMVSGDLAARTIAESADPATLARRYAAACDHEIGVELRDSVLIQRYLFGDRRRIARVIDGAERERRTARLILDYAMGWRSYRAVRRRILFRSPLVAAHLAWNLAVKNPLRPAVGVTRI
jgi:geranylgeranyl reductase family protein